MDRQKIIKCLKLLNYKLVEKGIYLELEIYGGAVMALAYDSARITKDIDAVFRKTNEVKKIIKEIAVEEGLPGDWINDTVKAYRSIQAEMLPYARFSNIVIYAPSTEYMFAMKCLAGRFGGSNDIEDIDILINVLNIQTYQQAIRIIEKFYDISEFSSGIREYLQMILH